MKLIRIILGKVILFVDWITSPKPIKRDPQEQETINQKIQDHAIYQFQACPFCVKVRRFLKKNNLPVTYKDAKKEPYRSELLAGGGKVKVPCLKIEKGEQATWMYESDDIIEFYKERILQ